MNQLRGGTFGASIRQGWNVGRFLDDTHRDLHPTKGAGMWAIELKAHCSVAQQGCLLPGCRRRCRGRWGRGLVEKNEALRWALQWTNCDGKARGVTFGVKAQDERLFNHDHDHDHLPGPHSGYASDGWTMTTRKLNSFLSDMNTVVFTV